MDFSIDVQRLIYMALDTVNGNLNIHFLTRLLEVIVLRLKLDKCEINFVGPDVLRAQKIIPEIAVDKHLNVAELILRPPGHNLRVYNGYPDNADVPLNSEFIIKRRNADDRLDVMPTTLIEMENINHAEHNAKSDSINLTKKNNVILPTEKDTIENDGALNLKILKRVEKMMYGDPSMNDDSVQIRSKTRNEEVQKTQNPYDQMMDKVTALSSKVNEIESLLDLKQIQEIGDSDTDTDNHLNSSSNDLVIHKTTRRNSFSSEIIIADELPASENNNIMLTDERAVSKLDRSLAVNEKTVSPPLNLMQIPLPDDKEHAVRNHRPVVLKGHIEQLMARMNKIEYVSRMLLITTSKLTDNLKNKDDGSSCSSDSELSSESSSDDNHNIDRRLSFNTRLKMLEKPERTEFQNQFGVKRQKKILDQSLSVGRFRKFFDDYERKFCINTQITTNKENINKISQRNGHLEDKTIFKKPAKTTHVGVMGNIDKHILRSSEVAGIVQSDKGATCVSCAKPVTMESTYKPLKYSTNCNPNPRVSMKSHLTHEMDMLIKQNQRMPIAKDLNLLEAIYKSIKPARKCFYNGTSSRTRIEKVSVQDDTVKRTPL